MWELDHKESWVLKNLCFWTAVLQKTLESPLCSKDIEPVNPKGNQSWIFIGRTDAEAQILWPTDAKSWLIRKYHLAEKDWRQEKVKVKVKVKVKSCPTLCYPWTVVPKLLRPWDSSGKNTGVGCHFLLQRIFLTQGSNPGFPHCRQTV